MAHQSADNVSSDLSTNSIKIRNANKKHLYEVFSGKVETDIIDMVLAGCNYDLDEAMDNILAICGDQNDIQKTNYRHGQSDKAWKTNQSTNNYSPPHWYSDASSTQSQQDNVHPGQHNTQGQGALYTKRAPGRIFEPQITSFQPSYQEAYSKMPDFRLRSPIQNNGAFRTSSSMPNLNPPQNRTMSPSNPLPLNYQKPQHAGFVPRPMVHAARSSPIGPGRPTPEKCLLIMRGLPGSGKSSRARNLQGKNGVILSTDDFFEKDGKYVFDPLNLGEAHEWNQFRAKRAMEDGKSPVIIDNTNTKFWEMKPYVVMALRFEYKVEFVESMTPWAWDITELARRNSHGVKEESLLKMMERYDRAPTVGKVIKSKTPKKETNRSQRENQTGMDTEHHRMIKSGSDSELRNEKGKTHPTVKARVSASAASTQQRAGGEKHQFSRTEPNRYWEERGATPHESKNYGHREPVPLDLFPNIDKTIKRVNLEDQIDNVVIDDDNEDEETDPLPQRSRKFRRKEEKNGEREHTDKQTEDTNDIDIVTSSVVDEEDDLMELDEILDRLENKKNQDQHKEAEQVNREDSVNLDCDTSSEWPFSQNTFTRTNKIFSEFKKRLKSVAGSEREAKFLTNDLASKKRDNKDINIKTGDAKVISVTSTDCYLPAAADRHSLLRDIRSKFESVVAETELSPIDPGMDIDKYIARKNTTPLSQGVIEMPSLAFTNTAERVNCARNRLSDEMNNSSSEETKRISTDVEEPHDLLVTNEYRSTEKAEPFDRDTDILTKRLGQTFEGILRTKDTEQSRHVTFCSYSLPRQSLYIDKNHDGLCSAGRERHKVNDVGINRDIVSSLTTSIGTSPVHAESRIRPLPSKSVGIDDKMTPSTNKQEHILETTVPDNSVEMDSSSTAVVDLTEDMHTKQSEVHFLYECFSYIPQEKIDKAFKLNEMDVVKTCDVLLKESCVDDVIVTSDNEAEEGSLSDSQDSDEIKDLDYEAMGLGDRTNGSFSPIGLDPSILAVGSLVPISTCEESVKKPQTICSTNVHHTNKDISLLSDKTVECLRNIDETTEVLKDFNTLTTSVRRGRKDDGELFLCELEGKEISKETLSVALDFRLVKELRNRFGADDDFVIDDLEANDLIINVEKNFGRKLYNKLKKRIQMRAAKNQEMLKQDEEYAKKLQQEEENRDVGMMGHSETDGKKASKSSTSPVKKKVFLNEFHDMAKGIPMQPWKEVVAGKPMKTHSEVAAEQANKRKRLHHMFPDLDEDSLDALLIAMQYNLEGTIAFVQASSGLLNQCGTYIFSDGNRAVRGAATKTSSSQIGPNIGPQAGNVVLAQGQSTLSSEIYQTFAKPSYTDYRAEAQLHADQRAEWFQKAAKAHAEKQNQLAASYAKQGLFHTERMREAHFRAATSILNKKNTDKDRHTVLDLHGLHVNEALEALEAFLYEGEHKSNKLWVEVITGRGNHSKGGVAKLKPAIMKRLEKLNYRFELLNQGSIRVWLR